MCFTFQMLTLDEHFFFGFVLFHFMWALIYNYTQWTQYVMLFFFGNRIMESTIFTVIDVQENDTFSWLKMHRKKCETDSEFPKHKKSMK